MSLELFGMEEQEDEPLTFPVQASLTVLTPVGPPPDGLTDPPPKPTRVPALAAVTVSDTASADLPIFAAFSDSVPTVFSVQDSQPIRHTASAPISLQLFGMEEQPDEPIELVAPAFQSLPPPTQTLQLPADMVAGSSSNVAAFAPSPTNLPSNSAYVNETADSTADYWLVLTKLMQVCLKFLLLFVPGTSM